MKPSLFILLLVAFGATRSTGQGMEFANDSISTAPEFSFLTLDGDPVSSSSLKGKVIILDFWSSDCNPCRRSMPQLEEFHRHYKSDPRVAFYFVNSGWETLEKAKAFSSRGRSGVLLFSWGEKYDLPFAYDRGSSTLKAFGFDSNPSTVIIDAKFRIRHKHAGYEENLSKYLSERVDRYLGERDVR